MDKGRKNIAEEVQHNENCPCKRIKCERHGDCAACRAHHTQKKKYPSTCERLKRREEKKSQGKH